MSTINKAIFLTLCLLLYACGPAADEEVSLQQQVTAAIASASDLPSENLTVTAAEGIVRVVGSLDCEDCGGMRTPAGKDTIQQTLGAVIRAVPGVESIEFDLQ